MKHLSNLLIATAGIFAMLLNASCASENSEVITERQDAILTVPYTKNQWTYISLRENKVLGTCPAKDTSAEESWSKRTDWDIAICNGHIRTNSGTSGNGKGGITVSPSAYDETDASSASSFSVDKDTVSLHIIH